MRIGISFSGGGARAAAHIGFIKALEEQQIKVAAIAGTSGGAIVGAMYAAGLSVDQMLQVAAKGRPLKIFKAGLPITGFTRLDYLAELLKAHLKVDTFEDLSIPLSLVATNLSTGRKAVLNDGALYPAVLASCAIPLVFKPVEIDGHIYVDGGIIDNMPVEPLLHQSDLIIGMNVMPITSQSNGQLDNMLEIGMRVFDISVDNNTKVNYPYCDVVVEAMKALDYHVFNFAAYQELFEIGYQSTLEQMPKIKSAIEEKQALLNKL
ncbi:MAG: patatin-like phospholipase family protein [Bacteroidota bacterium]